MMQKQKEAIDSKVSEVRVNIPKPEKPQKTFQLLPQNTTQVFYCMQCKKVTMTFNNNCKRAGHTQVMRIAKLKHYECQKCKKIVTGVKLHSGFSCTQCGSTNFKLM